LLHVHYHTLALDGVFSKAADGALGLAPSERTPELTSM
jgi:hypothetical protein